MFRFISPAAFSFEISTIHSYLYFCKHFVCGVTVDLRNRTMNIAVRIIFDDYANANTQNSREIGHIKDKWTETKIHSIGIQNRRHSIFETLKNEVDYSVFSAV